MFVQHFTTIHPKSCWDLPVSSKAVSWHTHFHSYYHFASTVRKRLHIDQHQNSISASKQIFAVSAQRRVGLSGTFSYFVAQHRDVVSIFPYCKIYIWLTFWWGLPDRSSSSPSLPDYPEWIGCLPPASSCSSPAPRADGAPAPADTPT